MMTERPRKNSDLHARTVTRKATEHKARRVTGCRRVVGSRSRVTGCRVGYRRATEALNTDSWHSFCKRERYAGWGILGLESCR